MAEQAPKDKAHTFVARVQVGYRVQIPEPLRAVLDLKEGTALEITIKVLPEPAEEKKNV